jgi:L-aminopeptidase/D-esterase-like protein
MKTLGFDTAVGHWTDADAQTGCTVVIPPLGNTTSCDVRGSSPSSRELEHLHPDRKLTEVHAILLTGGSAFGLAAADGVVGWLESKGLGYATPIGRIPIVPAAVIFDLAAGRPDLRPGPDQGRAACEAATIDEFETGRVGAGAGATVGKWSGIEHRVPGGVGVGHASADGARVAAIAVVNSVGDVLGSDGRVLAGSTDPNPSWRPPPQTDAAVPTNTVLVVLVTEAVCDKRDARWLASRGSDGVTVSVRPAHTRYDGDVTFAVVVPPKDPASTPSLDVLGHLATQAVATAVRDAVR